MRIALLVLLLACAAAAAAAQGRYEFNRLDEVPRCTWRAGGWACRPAPDDRATRAREIARLQDEIAVLKKELAAARAAPASARGDDRSALPSHGAIARARDYLARTWWRVVEMIVNIRKDVMGKG
jgi:hypothetical protein